MKTHQQSGFSLVEVAMALGVAGFCLSSIVALLPVGIENTRSSIEQTAAASIAREVSADLRLAVSGTKQVSPLFQFRVPQSGESASGNTPQTVYLDQSGVPAAGGVGSGPVAGGSTFSRYRVSVGFTPPNAGERTATAVRILVTWPALGDTNPAAWPTQYSGSFETWVSLKQN
ncbi:MAG: hypothetical protein ACFUZC_20800 [Chthoniobacteraceae bacterium]